MWSQDFKEFVGLLNSHDVEYLVVGAYAVGVHGRPRYTGDLDVWIRPTPENARRLIHVLEAFGFGTLGLKQSDFSQDRRVIELGYPPFRIDLITFATGLDFEKCWPNRLTIEYAGVLTAFIGLDDLKTNKKATGRPKDLGDLDELERKP